MALTNLVSAAGEVTDNGDQTYTFTPNDPTSAGAVDIIYAISDGEGGEDTATATFSVTPYEPPNQPPTAHDDFYPGTIVAGETITIDAAMLLANDHDPDGNHSDLQVTNVALLSGDGEFVDNGDGTWTITPAVDFVGNASLSYTVEDADGGTSTATATITVTPYVAPNQPPVVPETCDRLLATEDTALTITEANATDVMDNDLHV